MKKHFILYLLMTLMISGSLKATVIREGNFTQYTVFHHYAFNQDQPKVLLVFKVSGMKTEEDAKVIDDLLSERKCVISSTTDFKTGLCRVETDSEKNASNIIETIRYAGKKTGNEIRAELVEVNQNKNE